MKKYTPEEAISAFWSKVDKSGGDDTCWHWTGALSGDGYGRLKWHGSNHNAHRVSYEITYGEIPDGLCILHRCDVPTCVNPKHLFLGTHQDNSHDRDAKGRHSFAGVARLTEAEVRAIRQKFAAGGVSKASLSREFQISVSNIYSVLSRRTWRHL